jgi:hypothetical protein
MGGGGICVINVQRRREGVGMWKRQKEKEKEKEKGDIKASKMDSREEKAKT